MHRKFGRRTCCFGWENKKGALPTKVANYSLRQFSSSRFFIADYLFILIVLLNSLEEPLKKYEYQK